MKIKEIFDEISITSGDNAKMKILEKYKDNDLLKKVLYLIKSKRVKFFIRQIPEYQHLITKLTLEEAIDDLKLLSERKLTGNSAALHLQLMLEKLDPDDAYIIERIIDKDPKNGLGVTYINKVIPNLIEKTPYQGAKSFSEKIAKSIIEKEGYAYSDVKMDGRYANAIIQSGEVEFESRQGETTFIPSYSTLVKELSKFGNGVLNGEFTMVQNDGSIMPRYESNGIIASIVDIEGKGKMGDRAPKETEKKMQSFAKKHGDFKNAVDRIRFTVWDSITLEDYFNENSKIEYKDRLNYLFKKTPILECTRVSIVERKKVYSYGEAIEHFQEMLLRGEEGTILKVPTATWKNGKPNTSIKMKLNIDLDLKIVGFKYGTKGSKNEDVISTLITESSCGKIVTNPAGMKEDMMKYVTDNQDKLLGTIVEIRCCGLSQNSDGDYSTLHPSVVELRNDKTIANSLEECIEISNAAMGLTEKIK